MRPLVDFLLPMGAMGSFTRANLRRCARYFKACADDSMPDWFYQYHRLKFTGVYTDDSMPDWISQYRLKLIGVYTDDSMPDWVSQYHRLS